MIEDYQAQVKPIRPSAKRPKIFLPTNLTFIFLFGHHFDCPGSGSVFPIRIRIQIQVSRFNTDPPGSGSEALNSVKDPDPKE